MNFQSNYIYIVQNQQTQQKMLPQKQGRGKKDMKELKEAINLNKNKKKVDLSKEFQEFKMRIHQFQNKNEEIINRIREAYNPKKKNISQNNLVDYQPQANIVHYQNVNHVGNYHQNNNLVHYQQQNDQDSMNSSCDFSKNIVYNGNLMRNPNDIPQIQYKYRENHNDDYNTRRSGNKHNKPQQQKRMNKIGHLKTQGQAWQEYTVNQQRSATESPQLNYQQYIRQKSLSKVKSDSRQVRSKKASQQVEYQEVYDVQQTKVQKQKQFLSKRNDELQQQLVQKQNELLKLRSSEIRFKSYANNLKHLIEVNIQNYHEDIVLAKMFQMQKYIKKFQSRLRNVCFRLKDQIQQKKSKTNIRRSRQIRNNLKNRKEQSEEALSIDTKEEKQYNMKQIQLSSKVSKVSRSKQKNKSQTAQKQFKQMAALYETMINAKAVQCERFQRQIRQQIKQRQSTEIQLTRLKYVLEEKNNEIHVLKEDRKIVKEQSVKNDQKSQSKLFKERITKLEEQLLKKQIKQKQYLQVIQKLQKAKKTLHEEYTENLNKNKNLKNKTIQELQNKIRDNQNVHQQQLSLIKQRLVSYEQKLMNQDCEMLVLSSKLKKAEKQMIMKEEKLKQFENLLLKEQDHGYLLDQSLSVDNSILSMTEIKNMQDNVKNMQEEMEEKTNLIYQLQKEKYSKDNQLKSALSEVKSLKNGRSALEEKIADLKKQIQSLNDQLENEKDANSHRQLSRNNSFLQELQAERQIMVIQKQEMIQKNNDLVQQIKKIKELNLNINRQLIKNNTQYNYLKSQIDNLQQKNKHLRDQVNQLRNKKEDLQNIIRENSIRHEEACVFLNSELQSAKRAFNELQNKNLQENQDQNLLNSVNVSEVSFSYMPKRLYEQDLNTLKQRNKQLQTSLQLKESLYLQLSTEYKSNLQILKNDLKDKNKEILSLKNDIEMFKELQDKKLQNKDISDLSFENFKIDIYQKKIIELQNDLFVCKSNEDRLNEMLHQLYDTMKDKQQQREHLAEQLQLKERNYHELKELFELKELKLFEQKQSYENSQDVYQNSHNNHNNKLLVEDSQLMDSLEISCISNISDIFKKDQILQSMIKKGKANKSQNLKLFTKTAEYVKSLKKMIEDKDKRLKTLQKQLILMKKNEKKGWSEKKMQMQGFAQVNYFTQEFDNDAQDSQQYRDYDSVQIDRRRSKYFQIVKQVQHEKNLAIEENKILVLQIQNLQDQINRAEEQQINLMKIKDLYKQQINKLIEKNKLHTKQFEAEISRLRDQLDQSESYHNLEAIKQLTIKNIYAFAFMDDPNNRNAKKEEKRKQIEEYVKVLCSLLHFDVNTRDKMLAAIKR